MRSTIGCLGKIGYAPTAEAARVQARRSLLSQRSHKEVLRCCKARPPWALLFSESIMARRTSPQPVGRITAAAADRFWTLVDQSRGPESCWPYSGPRAGKTAGRFWMGDRYELAARVAWRLVKGEPGGCQVARPSCGSSACVNPAHRHCLTEGRPPEKRCGRCREIRPLAEFYRRNDARQSPMSECKGCQRLAPRPPKDAQARQRANEKLRERRRYDPRLVLLSGARTRAKRRGLPFDIGPEDIPIPPHCPVLGVPLVSRAGTGERRRYQDSPSLDRIDNALGYVRGNVIVVSLRANRIKVDATVEELERVAKFYRRLALVAGEGAE